MQNILMRSRTLFWYVMHQTDKTELPAQIDHIIKGRPITIGHF